MRVFVNNRRRREHLWGIIPVIVFLGIWEISARMHVIPGGVFFPPFSAVLKEGYYLVINGDLMEHYLRSLGRVVTGFVG